MIGVAKIGELVSSPQVGDPLLVDFPVKMRAAFLLLTYTVTGTNSLPVPTPILDPLRAVE